MTEIHFQVARKVFNETRGPASVKGQYSRLLKLYRAIVKFENWTGNGSGDPDLETRLASARNSSLALPEDLTANKIADFKDHGFYGLFENRYLSVP